MKNLALIQARSGSKGLPNKNIKELNGFPLMGYTIKAAIESCCFDEIMVSTDSLQYAEIAKKFGANVPFLRSDEMAQDNASTWDTVREVLTRYKELGKEFDYVALLQPTSPLRDADDIQEAFQKIQTAHIHNVVSITEVEHPVQWCFRLGNENLIDAKKIINADYNFYADYCYGFEMSREKSIDIDTALDFQIAETIMRASS